jgi:hypothetical protein
MLGNIKNKTLGLSLQPQEFQNGSYSWIQVLEAKDIMWPNLLRIPKTSQGVLTAASCLLFIIGTYFQFIIYEYLYQQYKKKELTIVNKLGLVLYLMRHTHSAFGVLAGTLIILNGDALNSVVGGHWFCIVFIHYSQFAFYYSFVGNLGVSIYRILLIKHNCFLKDVIGEKVMMNLILYGGILLATVFTIILNFHDFAKLFQDTCMIVPKLPALQILDEYEQSRGNISILSYYFKLNIGNKAAMALLTVSEIIIYVVFFHHMYKHDNSVSLRRLLEPKVIKGRNRRNAITFFGQFCSFLLELIGLLLIAVSYTIGSRNNHLILITHAYWRLTYTLKPMVEVITSDVLRAKILKINFYNIIFGLK